MIKPTNTLFENIKKVILDEIIDYLMYDENLRLLRLKYPSINFSTNQSDLIHDLIILIYYDILTELEYYNNHFWTRTPSVTYNRQLLKTYISIKSKTEIRRLLKRVILSYKPPIYLISIPLVFLTDIHELQFYERTRNIEVVNQTQLMIEVGGHGNRIEIISKAIGPSTQKRNLNILVQSAIIQFPNNFQIIGRSLRGTLPLDLGSIEVIGIVNEDLDSIENWLCSVEDFL